MEGGSQLDLHDVGHFDVTAGMAGTSTETGMSEVDGTMDGESLPPYMDVQVQAKPWMVRACRLPQSTVTSVT